MFGAVFDPLLKPELDSRSIFYAPIGAASGAALGGIIANIPGAIAGAFFGWSAGQVRDRHGLSVYDAFLQLDQPKRREILIALGAKMLTYVHY